MSRGLGQSGGDSNAVSPFAIYDKDMKDAPRLTTTALAAVASHHNGPVAPAAGAASPYSAARYPFAEMCGLFEGILSAVNKAQQCARLETFWKALPKEESFFPFMRLLLPQLDNQRSSYHLRESKLAQLYVEALGLHRRSSEAQRLLQWKDPSKSSVETTSFSDVLYVMLQHKGGFQRTGAQSSPPRAGIKGETGVVGAPGDVTTSYTVEAINVFLDTLADASSTDERRMLLIECLQRTTPTEQRWLVRIILKDMKFRMSHTTLLTAFHPTALDKFNSTSDLVYVCDACLEEIREPAPGSSAAGVFLFLPLRPMLASPVTAKKLERMLREETILLEPKYDGERIMIHLDADKVMYWTRNAKNYTGIYGPKFDSTIRKAFAVGSVVNIPHVHNLNTAQSVDEAGEGPTDERAAQGGSSGAGRGKPNTLVTLDNAILDGELLLYDSSTGSFIPFGHNRSFATSGEAFAAMGWNAEGGAAPSTSAADGEQRWFCYMVFDIVFLNGKSLMHLPLSARRGILQCVLRQEKHRVERVPSRSAKTTQEILAELEKMIDAQLEGLVLKTSNSNYVPAERKDKWVKLKTDHIAGLADTMDLVVVGGYHGTKFGVRSISHFLLAAWVNSSSENPHSGDAKFHTVCKVGTGFTSEELGTMQAALEPHWQTMPSRQVVPPWLDGWKPVAADLIPDVYVHPSNSIVLEVFGYAFVTSSNYRVGFTVRFPRMLHVRFDKSLDDATDLSALLKIKAASGDALKRWRAQQSDSQGEGRGGEDELLTVMSLKWKRRREGASATGSGGGSNPRTDATGSSSLLASGADGPLTLRGGRVLQWAALRSGARQLSVPERTIAHVPRQLGVTRLAEHEEVIDDLFRGYEFCVLFTSKETCSVDVGVTGNKRALERCLLQHGAVVVANAGASTSLQLASSRNAPKVDNWIQLCRTRPQHVAARYASSDVVHCDWVAASIEAGEVLPLTPRYVLHASPALQDKFKILLDPFEDSFYEPCTADSLTFSLAIARKLREARVLGASDASTLQEGATKKAPPQSLVEACNRVYALKKELGILNAAAVIVVPVILDEGRSSGDGFPLPSEYAPAPAPAKKSRGKGKTSEGAVLVTDDVAKYILGTGAYGTSRGTHHIGIQQPVNSGSAVVKLEPRSDDEGANNSNEEVRSRRWGTVSADRCTPAPQEELWTVAQLLALIRVTEEHYCRVELTDLSIATHVVTQHGAFLSLD